MKKSKFQKAEKLELRRLRAEKERKISDRRHSARADKMGSSDYFYSAVDRLADVAGTPKAIWANRNYWREYAANL